MQESVVASCYPASCPLLRIPILRRMMRCDGMMIPIRLPLSQKMVAPKEEMVKHRRRRSTPLKGGGGVRDEDHHQHHPIGKGRSLTEGDRWTHHIRSRIHPCQKTVSRKASATQKQKQKQEEQDRGECALRKLIKSEMH